MGEFSGLWELGAPDNQMFSTLSVPAVRRLLDTRVVAWRRLAGGAASTRGNVGLMQGRPAWLVVAGLGWFWP